MTQPSAAGTRVSTGKLRVDAARAVDKLRAYQLPDPLMWVLEVVRAAVASKAESIVVSGDADDVVVSWAGPPIGAEALTRLFDELVDPSPSAERRHLRLLATGVNTALGLDPRYVDVVSLDGAAGAQRVRYTPKLLQPADPGAIGEGLRALRADPIMPRADAPARGVLVHLKRLPLLGAVPLMIGFGEPPELGVVRRCCDDLRVPLTVGRSALGVGRSHGDLFRLPLGGGIDGFVALMTPSFARATAQLDVAELGVMLARYTMPLEEYPSPQAPIPVRVHVDAPRMPTNASRSAVRLDEPPVREALELGREVFGPLVARLANELGVEAVGEWSAVQSERLRAAALHLLAARAAGRHWRAGIHGMPGFPGAPESLRPLVDLPLLRDALGRPRSARSFPLGDGDSMVHFGSEPLANELEPWLGHVLWVPPGDAARVLLGGWAPDRADRFARVAERYSRRRVAFRAEKERAAKLTPSVPQLLVTPLRAPGRSLHSLAPAAVFDVPGLEGELALCDPGLVRGGTLSVRIAKREIELVSMDVAVAFEAVATSDGLKPRVDYRAVRHDPAYVALRAAVEACAVVATEGLALRVLGKRKAGDRSEGIAEWIGSPDRVQQRQLARLLRAGVAHALRVLEASSPEETEEETRAAASATLADSRSPLVSAPIWPHVDGGWWTTRELLAEARRGPGVIGAVFEPAQLEKAPFGRAVLVLSRVERSILARIVAPAIVVDYGPALAGLRDSSEPEQLARDLVPPLGAGLALRAPSRTAAIAWGGSAHLLTVVHWGRNLETRKLEPMGAPCRVVVDDGTVVPTADWRSLRTPSADPYPVAQWERELAHAFVDALAGAPPIGLVLGAARAEDATAAIDALFSVLGDLSVDPVEWLGPRRVGALRAVRIHEVLGTDERVSLVDLEDRFGAGPIPFVPRVHPSGVDLGDWHPIAASDVRVAVLARFTERTFTSGLPEVERLRRLALRNEMLEHHRRALPSDPTVGWRPPIVPVKIRGATSASVAFALSSEEGLLIEVSIEGRRFTTLSIADGLPLRALVDMPEDAVDETFTALTKHAAARARYVASLGARALLQDAIARDPASLLDSPEVRRLLFAWARSVAHSRLKSDHRALAALADAPAYRTIRGDLAPLAAAATAGETLRLAVWDDVWLGPLEGERASAYDGSILRLPPTEEEQVALRELLTILWLGRRTQDVTVSVAKLQTERRLARGLVEAPRIPMVVDPRFRFSLSELLADDEESLTALGFGEAALDRATQSRILLFEDGIQTRTVEENLIPRVVVAACSPLVVPKRALSKATLERFDKALRSVTSRLVRRAADDIPPGQLPPWVRDVLRESCLAGGSLHLERLGKTPLFETTAKGWISPDEVKEQADRFGDVWYTSERLAPVPLEPSRHALLLSPPDAKALGAWVTMFDATRELELDGTARIHMALPPIASLDPTPAEREAAVSVVALEMDGIELSHGTITVLAPQAASRRHLTVSRRRQPLGRLEDPARWPAASHLDDPELTPDRTWSAPEDDLVLLRMRGRIRAAVDRALSKAIPYPHAKPMAARISALHAAELGVAAGTPLAGVVWLETRPGPGRMILRAPDGDHEVEPRNARGVALPLHGQLWFASSVSTMEVLNAFELAYLLLLERLARTPSNPVVDEPLAAHAIFAMGASLPLSDTVLGRVKLPCFAPEPLSAKQLATVLAAGGFFTIATLDDRARALEASHEHPLLVLDGSELAERVQAALGSRAVDWRSALRARVLGADAALLGAEDQARPRGVPTSGASTSDPPPRPARPVSALERAVDARLRALALGGLDETRVDPRRKKPVVQVEGRVLWLAGRHDAVRTARGAVESESPEADALVGVLVARAIGALHRSEARIGAPAEVTLMIGLLDG